jgi:hypothetical protein
MQIATRVSANKSPFLDEFDAPVDAWSLAELDQLSDLESVRSACRRTDVAEAWQIKAD